MMGSLAITRSSMKNELFEIGEGCREFNFQLYLQIEFTKSDEVFKNKLFADSWLNWEKIEFGDTGIDKLLDTQHNKFSSRVKKRTYKGSDWTVNSIIQHQFFISEIAPFE